MGESAKDTLTSIFYIASSSFTLSKFLVVPTFTKYIHQKFEKYALFNPFLVNDPILYST